MQLLGGAADVDPTYGVSRGGAARIYVGDGKRPVFSLEDLWTDLWIPSTSGEVAGYGHRSTLRTTEVGT